MCTSREGADINYKMSEGRCNTYVQYKHPLQIFKQLRGVTVESKLEKRNPTYEKKFPMLQYDLFLFHSENTEVN